MQKLLKVKKWGNSQGIMIPKELLKSVGVSEPIGQELVVSINEKSQIVMQPKKSSSRLMDEFGYLEDQKPAVGLREYDWGKPRGNEQF